MTSTVEVCAEIRGSVVLAQPPPACEFHPRVPPASSTRRPRQQPSALWVYNAAPGAMEREAALARGDVRRAADFPVQIFALLLLK